jgi:stage II sporulation protein M
MSVPAETDSDPDSDSEADADPGDSWGTASGSVYSDLQFTRWFRWHLVAALAVFFGTAFAGYAVFGAIPVEGLADVIPGDSSPLGDIDFTFPSIMFNNLRALLLMGMGAVTGGLLTLFGLFVNGLLVGAVVGLVIQEASWAVVLAALLPHGVIELSAFFMAASIGLRVPHRIVRYLMAYDETPITRAEAVELGVLSAIMIVMIVVAAWIEVNVTPDVIEWVGGPNALGTAN